MHSFYINSNPFHCEEDENQSKKAYDFFEKATMHTIGFYILISLLKTNQPISSWEDVNISYEFICCLHWFPFHNYLDKCMKFGPSFSSVQSLSRVRLFATPWIAARQASLSITNSRSLPQTCPLSQWCHPPISSSVIPFSSCPQSFPASRSFPMSQLFASGGQSIGVSASTSVLPMNTKD